MHVSVTRHGYLCHRCMCLADTSNGATGVHVLGRILSVPSCTAMPSGRSIDLTTGMEGTMVLEYPVHTCSIDVLMAWDIDTRAMSCTSSSTYALNAITASGQSYRLALMYCDASRACTDGTERENTPELLSIYDATALVGVLISVPISALPRWMTESHPPWGVGSGSTRWVKVGCMYP